MNMEWQYHISSVRPLVRSYVEAQTGPFWGWAVPDKVAKALYDLDGHGFYGSTSNAGPRLTGQVKRTLDELSALTVSEAARDGKILIRRQQRRGTEYIPIAHAQAGAVQAEAAALQRQQIRRQWETVNSLLADVGYVTSGPPHEEPELTLATWTRLANDVHESRSLWLK